MSRRATGSILSPSAGRASWALRFTAYGKRRFVTLGRPEDGWNHAKAQQELSEILESVASGNWRPNPDQVQDPNPSSLRPGGLSALANYPEIAELYRDRVGPFRVGIVYFFVENCAFSDDVEALVKIGFTSKPSSEYRLKGCQTGNPRELRILRELPGIPVRERQLHDLLSDFREHGEWFRLNAEVIELIRKPETLTAEELVCDLGACLGKKPFERKRRQAA